MDSGFNSLRASAYGQNRDAIGLTSMRLLCGLIRQAKQLFHKAVDCKHENKSRPYNEHQHCLDCGASRVYAFTESGIFTGPWRSALTPISTARPVIIESARPAYLRPVTPLKAREIPTHCKDCDQMLDAFGVCPNARSIDVAKMAAPVNCGKLPVSAVPRIVAATNQLMDKHGIGSQAVR